MAGRFIPTRYSFILTSTNVWTKVADWTEWQIVCQTSSCFDLTVSSIEIDRDIVKRFHDAARNGDVSLIESMLQEGVPVDCVNGDDQTALFRAAEYNKTDVIRLHHKLWRWYTRTFRCIEQLNWSHCNVN